MLSPEIFAKRVMKDKMCFENTRHFAFIKHRQKMLGFGFSIPLITPPKDKDAFDCEP